VLIVDENEDMILRWGADDEGLVVRGPAELDVSWKSGNR
jgi:hypothetical protein